MLATAIPSVVVTDRNGGTDSGIDGGVDGWLRRSRWLAEAGLIVILTAVV